MFKSFFVAILMDEVLIVVVVPDMFAIFSTNQLNSQQIKKKERC